MAPRLVLDPGKPQEQMTPAELRVLALRQGVPMSDEDVTQQAAEQAAKADAMQRFGSGLAIDSSFGEAPDANEAAQGALMQNQAQNRRGNLLDALKATQTARIQKATQEREAAMLQNTIGNTAFEHELALKRLGLEAATKNAELGKINRLPPEAIERISALQSGQNAINEAEKSFMTDPAAYFQQHEAHAAAIAPAVFDLKAKPSAVEDTAKMMPGPLSQAAALTDAGKRAAHTKFEGLRAKSAEVLKQYRGTLRGAGYNVPEALESARPNEDPNYMPAGAVKRLTNKAGQHKYIDAKGNEVKP